MLTVQILTVIIVVNTGMGQIVVLHLQQDAQNIAFLKHRIIIIGVCEIFMNADDTVLNS